MIIFGGRASKIGDINVPYNNCSYCGSGDTQRISVYGKYAHVFWIPIFPIGKKAVAECTHCMRTIEQKEFSPELKSLYQENKHKAKRPFWHWLGLGFVGSILLLATYVGLSTEEDPRSKFLKEDEAMMVSNPTMEDDSISFKIKTVFDSFTNEDIDPSEFKYLTKTKHDKALVLVQIPKLRKVKKKGRAQAMEMIEMITDNQSILNGKDVYIGVKGAVGMMLIKTPTYEKNSKLALTSELYDFYGPKPQTN